MNRATVLLIVLLGCARTPENQSEAQTPAQSTETESRVNSADGEPLKVPTDTGAQYFIVDRGGTPERPTITTKRIGPSGTSYARREYDCARKLVRYLGEGETLDEVNTSTPDPDMGPIVDESIADYVGRAACASR